jgi:hypothetical protein
MSASPRELYEFALRERKSKDPVKRREACEKGWLAVVGAVDIFLARNGMRVNAGDIGAHKERKDLLFKLADTDMTARRIANLMSEVADSLHGTCFYDGKDSKYMTTVLNETVSEILVLTGCANDCRIED